MKPHDIDRTEWATGPWDDEPDRIQFKTLVGLPGLIVRNRLGSLCGYAAVGAGHPLYKKRYDDVDVDVHGGLTFADKCQEDGPICHVPEPGESDDVWWFGFDCGHWQDISPAMEASELKYGFDPIRTEHTSYKTVAYVRAEVETLAEQLVTLGS